MCKGSGLQKVGEATNERSMTMDRSQNFGRKGDRVILTSNFYCIFRAISRQILFIFCAAFGWQFVWLVMGPFCS